MKSEDELPRDLTAEELQHILAVVDALELMNRQTARELFGSCEEQAARVEALIEALGGTGNNPGNKRVTSPHRLTAPSI